MRSSPLRLLGLPVLALFALTAGACDETSSGNPGGNDIDLPDDEPPPPNGQTPPTPPPAGPTGVKVTAISAAKPRADVRVLFHKADGSVSEDLKTDANGVVQGTGEVPAMVTVVMPKSGPGGHDTHLTTYSGVEAGDELVVDVTPPDASILAPRLGVTFAMIPLSLPEPFELEAHVDRSCGARVFPGETATVHVQPSCVQTPSAVLGVALDDFSRPIAYARKTGITLPAEGAVTPVSLEPWASPATVNIRAEGIPVDATFVDAELVAITEKHAHNAFADGGNIRVEPATFIVPPASIAPHHQGVVIEERDLAGSDFTSRAIVKRQAASSEVLVSFTQALPRMTSGALDLVDKTRPAPSWTVERALSGADEADIGFATVLWTQLFGDATVMHTWTLVVPANATTVKAPAVPADLALATPANTNAADIVLDSIVFVDSGLVRSYKDAKRVPVRAGRDARSDLGVPLPADDTVRLTSFNGFFTTFVAR